MFSINEPFVDLSLAIPAAQSTERVLVNTAGSGTRLSSLSVTAAVRRPNIASENNGGQPDNREYCPKVIYINADQDSDCGSDEDGREGQERREAERQERSW